MVSGRPWSDKALSLQVGLFLFGFLFVKIPYMDVPIFIENS